MKRIKILILLSVTLVHLASSGLGAGAMLCFGADGHVTLESAAASCCAKASEAPAPASTLPVASSLRSCGDCIDIALPASIGRAAPPPSLAPARQVCLFTSPPLDLPRALLTALSRSARFPGRRDAALLDELASVVLHV
jgi:hypothetical protein